MKLINEISEALSRMEIEDRKKTLSKKELTDSASRFWDEGISLAKSGKSGASFLALETARMLAPTKGMEKEFLKWEKAAKEAMSGSPKKLEKLLSKL